MSQPTTTATDTTSPIRVLVLGKLGELVKKIYELEYVLSYRPNPITAAELASYNLVLAAWPVDDKEDVRVLITAFKLELDKFHLAERDFESAIRRKNEIEVCQISAEYARRLSDVRASMKRLNTMGKHIGDSIWLEIKDANTS
jgi:hypothetical protein